MFVGVITSLALFFIIVLLKLVIFDVLVDLLLGQEVLKLKVGPTVQVLILILYPLHKVFRLAQFFRVVLFKVLLFYWDKVVAQIAVIGILLLKPHVSWNICFCVVQFIKHFWVHFTHFKGGFFQSIVRNGKFGVLSIHGWLSIAT